MDTSFDAFVRDVEQDPVMKDLIAAARWRWVAWELSEQRWSRTTPWRGRLGVALAMVSRWIERLR